MQEGFNLYYKPKSFCREYVEIKGASNLLVQFMATALGIKKSYDDWFPLDKIDEIKELCRDYDLNYKFDWIFVPCEDVRNVISGGKRLPTTKMFGLPFNKRFIDVEKGNVHVFFSKSKKDLELSFRNGWYPLILNNRAIHKPYIDILRFGYFLGYPNCCIDFFRRYNNHSLYNYPFETLKNTKTKFSKYCNWFLKDQTFSYIYHMPCSYNCKATEAYAQKLRARLLELEPELVNKIDSMLTKPLLVFGERDAYIFEGQIKNNSINYSSFELISNVYNPNENLFFNMLKEGNRIEIYTSHVTVYKDYTEVYKQQKESNEGFILQFKD